MFPTINQCFYQDSPWEGVNLPNHGEVWSLPWKYEISEDDLLMSVCGVRLPYTLEKRIQFDSDNSFIIEYKLENHVPFTMKFIWAAHPLLNIDGNSVIKLPENIDKVINIMHDSKRLGEYGRFHNWPITITPSG